MNKARLLLWVLLGLTPLPAIANSDEAYHARMQWRDDARLGMFPHCGVYSVFWGEYRSADHGRESLPVIINQLR